MSKALRIVLIAVVAAPMAASQARAALIYQSATAVVTSLTGESSIGGVEADTTFYSGVTFQLTSTTQITAIGGHFTNSFSTGNNEIFGAIVAVSSLTAAPTPASIANNALASTLITLPTTPPGFEASDTVSGAVNVTLGPGFYSEIFGSGLFGATGTSIAAETAIGPNYNGPVNSNGVTTYAVRVSDGMSFLQNPGARYFVNGTVGAAVPEPSSILLAALGLSGLGGFAALRRRGA